MWNVGIEETVSVVCWYRRDSICGMLVKKRQSLWNVVVEETATVEC